MNLLQGGDVQACKVMMCKPAKSACAWAAANQGGLLGWTSSPINYICVVLHVLSLPRLGLELRFLTPSLLSLWVYPKSYWDPQWIDLPLLTPAVRITQEIMIYTPNTVSPLNLWDLKKQVSGFGRWWVWFIKFRGKALVYQLYFSLIKKKKYSKVAVNENKSTMLVLWGPSKALKKVSTK